MTYQIFSAPLTIPPAYIPPEFKNFSVPNNVTLPDGGSLETPVSNSVIQILAQSTGERQYFLSNDGVNEVRLFFGQEATVWESEPQTPLRLPAGNYSLISMSMAKMAVFGWSMGGSVISVGVFTT